MILKGKIKFAKRIATKERPKTTLETLTEEELNKLEEIRAQKDALYESNVELFEAMSSLEAEEAQALDTIKRLAHTSSQPPEGLNMVTGKTARMAEGKKFVVEVSYKRAADYYDLRELPPDVLGVPGVVKEIHSVKIDMLGDKRCEKARRKGKWLTPSVSVRRLEDATPPGGDPRYATNSDS